MAAFTTNSQSAQNPGRANVAQVSRAPLGRYECCFCFLTPEAERGYIIDDSPVICIGCTQRDIIPKFHAALKHEFNYPVEWTSTLTLQPADFAELFDNFDNFLAMWTEKEREYHTPGRDRLYHAGCETFVGDRTGYLFQTVHCMKCLRSICTRCGYDRHAEHQCKSSGEADSEDPPGSKRCPNPSCRTLIVLEDGCNDVTCACLFRFCYCCGLHITAEDHDHWSRRQPNACPRFGQPGATNLLFSEDLAEDVAEGMAEDGEIVEHGIVIPDEGLTEEEVDVFQWSIRVLEQTITLRLRGPNGAPRAANQILPDFLGTGLLRDIALVFFERHANEPGLTQLQMNIASEHQEIMESVVRNARQVLEDENLNEAELEDLAGRLGTAAAAIAANTPIYTQFEAVRDNHAEFSARHEIAMEFIGTAPGEVLRNAWPRMHMVLLVYKAVSSANLEAAAPPRE